MKKLLLSAAFIAASFTGIAQVGFGTTTPDASSVLDITSTTQGLLPPRMTEAQMIAIAAPVAGLNVYCMDCATPCMYFLMVRIIRTYVIVLPQHHHHHYYQEA